MSIFCLTGEFVNIGYLQQELVRAGHSLNSSVTKAVNYVVEGDKANKVKIRRANELDIAIWPEDDLVYFLKLEAVRIKPVTVEVPLEELKRWAQLAGVAINPKVYFLEGNYEGMKSLAQQITDESIKELNESIHEVLDGKN